MQELPYAETNFEELRQENCIYVDKTALIYDLAAKKRPFFLARPRRFGKSLLVSTLHSLFANGLKYFQGLAIEKLWQDRTYPVLYLDFSEFSQTKNADEFASCFNEEMRNIALRDFGLQVEEDASAAETYEAIVSKLKKEEQRLVLLIDEYDAPLTAFLKKPQELARIQRALGHFYNNVKAIKGYRFMLVTGVVHLIPDDMIDGLNELCDISQRTQYSSLMGFTEAELAEYFGDYLDKVQSKLGLSRPELLSRLQENYGGYCFDREHETEVMNVWSLLSFFNNKDYIFHPYWVQSDNLSTYLIALFRNLFVDKEDNSCFCPEFLNDFSISRLDLLFSQLPEYIKPQILLLQAGYFAMNTSEDRPHAGLRNQELRRFVTMLFYKNILCRDSRQLWALDDQEIDSALRSQEPQALSKVFDYALSAFSYQSKSPEDGPFLRDIIRNMFAYRGFFCGKDSAPGRSDLELEYGGCRLIFEFKLPGPGDDVQQLLEEARTQIKERRYGEVLPLMETRRYAVVLSAEHKKVAEIALVDVLNAPTAN